MKKLKRLLIILVALCMTFIFLGHLFFNDFTSYSKYKSVNDWFKKHYGGIVVNKTDHDICIKQWLKKVVVPPGKSSRDVGVFDADFVTVKNKTMFNNKVLNNGDIKLCDFATFEIKQRNGESIDYIDYSLGHTFCEMFPFLENFKRIRH